MVGQMGSVGQRLRPLFVHQRRDLFCWIDRRPVRVWLPFRVIDSDGSNHTGFRLVIVKHNGLGRYLHLNTHRSRLALRTAGQIWGHAAASQAYAVAAVNVATASGGPFLGGGFNPVEDYSSDGPRRIFYAANGTP